MKKIIISVLILLAILVFAYFLYDSIIIKEQEKKYASFRSRIYLQTVILAETLTKTFKMYFTQAKQVSHYLGEKGKVPTVAELKFLYNNISKIDLNLLNIAFLDPDGTCLSNYQEGTWPENDINYSSSDYFKETSQTGEIAVSKHLIYYPLPAQTHQYTVLTIISPVNNLKNERQGYLVFHININKLEEFALYKYQEKNVRIAFYLIDTDTNEVICFPERALSHNLSMANEKFSYYLCKLAKKNEKLTVLKTFSGEKAFFSSTALKIGGNSMAVVAVLPYKDALISTTDLLSSLALFMIPTILVLFFILGFIMYHSIIVKKLKRKITSLEIIIDENTKKQEVDNIIQTDYFYELKEKLKSIKKLISNNYNKNKAGRR